MQQDGNLVISGDAGAVWAPDTYGHPGAVLALQDDGNVIIYDGSTPLWSTETAVAAPAAPSASGPVSSASESVSAAPADAGASDASSTYGTVVGSGLDRVYITKEGDQLEALAAYFYGDPVHQQRIRDDNPSVATWSGPLPAGMRLAVSEDASRGDTVAPTT